MVSTRFCTICTTFVNCMLGFTGKWTIRDSSGVRDEEVIIDEEVKEAPATGVLDKDAGRG